MSTGATTTGKFAWHEQVSSDPKQAQDFYTQLFGWGTELYGPSESNYAMISARGQSHGGFATAMEGAPPPHWLSHIRVEKLEDTIEKATGAGGGGELTRFTPLARTSTRGRVRSTRRAGFLSGGSGPD